MESGKLEIPAHIQSPHQSHQFSLRKVPLFGTEFSTQFNEMSATTFGGGR